MGSERKLLGFLGALPGAAAAAPLAWLLLRSEFFPGWRGWRASSWPRRAGGWGRGEAPASAYRPRPC